MKETCAICKGPVPTEGNCSKPIIVREKHYYVCSPKCEFALGIQHGQEYQKRRDRLKYGRS
jgi:hypothetical protein